MKLPLVLLTTALICISGAHAAENIFPEGSFDVLAGSGLPEAWSLPDKNYAKSLGASYDLESEKGNNFMRVTNTNPAASAHFSATIDIPENTLQIRLTYKMRGKDIKRNSDPSWAGGFMGGGFVDSEGKESKGILPSKRVKTNVEAWEECEDIFPVPVGAKKLHLQPGLYFTMGTFDIDDVQLFLE